MTQALRVTVHNGKITCFRSNDPTSVYIGFNHGSGELGGIYLKFSTVKSQQRFVQKFVQIVGANSTSELKGWPVRFAEIPWNTPSTTRNRSPNRVVAVGAIDDNQWINIHKFQGGTVDWVETMAAYDAGNPRTRNTQLGAISLNIALDSGEKFDLKLGDGREAAQLLQELARKLERVVSSEQDGLLRVRHRDGGKVDIGGAYGSTWLCLTKFADNGVAAGADSDEENDDA